MTKPIYIASTSDRTHFSERLSFFECPFPKRPLFLCTGVSDRQVTRIISGYNTVVYSPLLPDEFPVRPPFAGSLLISLLYSVPISFSPFPNISWRDELDVHICEPRFIKIHLLHWGLHWVVVSFCTPTPCCSFGHWSSCHPKLWSMNS